MNNLQKTKVFLFNKAQYDVEDAYGNKGILLVNYKKKKYKVKSLTSKLHEDSIQELTEFAEDLLNRKHNVNFAGK